MKITADRMARAAAEVSGVLKVLANAPRLLILCRLIEGETSVGQLASCLGVRDSTMSQNLSLMRKNGIVAARREAQTMWYSICDPKVRVVLETLHRAYCAPKPLCRTEAKKSRKGKK